MIPAGNYRTRLWRDGVWWRATVHALNGRCVLDQHVHADSVEAGRTIVMEDSIIAIHRDQLYQLAGVVHPPVKLGAVA